MGNCLNSCHKGAKEEDFEASGYGSSTDLEYNQPPIIKSKIQRENHDSNALISKSSPAIFSQSSTNKEAKGVVRVKIVLSKEDAARLLSKLEGGGDGGLLGAAISELRRTDGNRMSVAGHGPCCSTWTPVLESIPENASMN